MWSLDLLTGVRDRHTSKQAAKCTLRGVGLVRRYMYSIAYGLLQLLWHSWAPAIAEVWKQFGQLSMLRGLCLASNAGQRVQTACQQNHLLLLTLDAAIIALILWVHCVRTMCTLLNVCLAGLMGGPEQIRKPRSSTSRQRHAGGPTHTVRTFEQIRQPRSAAAVAALLIPNNSVRIHASCW